jgi:hypothetical protein
LALRENGVEGDSTGLLLEHAMHHLRPDGVIFKPLTVLPNEGLLAKVCLVLT